MGQKGSVLPIADEVLPTAAGAAPNQASAAPSRGSLDTVPKDEFPHFGVVSVQLSWLTANVRYTPEQQSDITVTGKGALFFGANTPSPEIIQELHHQKLYPREVSLLDSRAHQLLITYSQGGWHAISSPEIFSRHSGTCIIIGDRQIPGGPYKIKLGDCFRLGSVGVVVSEIKTDKGIERKLDNKRLQYLREEALAFETDQDEAALAAEEEEELISKKKQKSQTSLASPAEGSGRPTSGGAARGGISSYPLANDENTSYNFQEGCSSPFFCYMCYETHDTPEDHLVAPCECKGDTRYLHVQCLQKWYQSSVCGSQAHVIRTTSNGAPACKICGAAYKTAFRNNGVKTSLLEVDHPGPYISLVVVTRHDTSPGLFNTKFRLNFGPAANNPDEDGPSELSIGRSSLCNMVLDYRTVSTVHAKLLFKNGEFFVQDTHSSNGTMVYLQGPLPLVNNQVFRLRMGRSTLALQAKRSISASIRGTLQRAPLSTPCTATLDELQTIMSLAPPYIPRSIRQVDQSPTALASAPLAPVPLPSSFSGTAPAEVVRELPMQPPPPRLLASPPVSDVSSWLSSIERQAIFNVTAGTRGGDGGGGPMRASPRLITQSPRREIAERPSEREEEEEGGERQEQQQTVPVPRAIEFSSTLLPDEMVGGGGGAGGGPIVLGGGDRVSLTGSRPGSARPHSARSQLAQTQEQSSADDPGSSAAAMAPPLSIGQGYEEEEQPDHPPSL